MKKILVKLVVAVFALGLMVGCFAGCTAREDTLRIYNWGDYIDPVVVEKFEEWYARPENGGKRVKVEYKEFLTNEDLLTSLELGDDWDVVCPSDYMIDRMIVNEMLEPLDEAVIKKFNAVGNPLVKDLIAEYVDPGNLYCVPYIWGTFGIMYDTTRVTGANAEKLDPETVSWDVLWDPAFSGQLYMKDSVRDSFTVAMLYYYRDELKTASNDFTDYGTDAYQTLMNNIFQVFNKEELQKGMDALRAQYDYVEGYEVDDGKTDIAEGTSDAMMGLFWSCDAGYVMSDSEEEASFFSCSGAPTLIEGNKNLGYVVPVEGSNLWVDGWVIPKTAKNKDAANKWIEFTMDPEIARLNAEYAGSPSANAGAMEELEDEYRAIFEANEANGFFNKADDPARFFAMFMEARFPSAETLERCAVMKDFGGLLSEFETEFNKVTSGH